MTEERPRAKRCENCGDPLDAPEDYGTEADGSRSTQYCRLCYGDGKFREGLPGQGDALHPR